ncbi:hypothetical protein [Sulfurimonas sp.]|uniref:hypothetical protein n=1 Tax=Sulfurimonas sp. TaxID=2022749 RepID=UPI002615E33E|nr:hypothetical protein [Sulfurimonas sp.]
MRTFFIFFALTVIFSACAHKSAFEDFNITKEQALSEDVIQSSKIQTEDKVIGIVSAIYLNKVRAKKYKDNEFFYISLYIKKEYSQDVNFLLNNKKPIKVEKLNAKNEFISLTSSKAQWLRYYKLVFPKESNLLRLEVKSKEGSSGKMIFKKEE